VIAAATTTPLLQTQLAGNTSADPADNLSSTQPVAMPRDDPAAAAPSDSGSSPPPFKSGCSKCRKAPAAGTKMHVCSRCKHVHYCNVECQRADWASHKLDCKEMVKSHERSAVALASDKAVGSRRKRNQTLLWEWYETCYSAGGAPPMYTSVFGTRPDMGEQVACLAYQHRGESPVICVFTSPDGTDATTPRVAVIPR
jgi:hypothetical protein